MKKQAMKSVLGMLVFSALYSGVVPSALAYGTAPPTGSTEAYFLNPALPLYQMSDLQKELIAQLKLFDRTYCRWAHEGISVPSIWRYLAVDVFGPYNDMPCKGGESDSNFILRGKLASGICSLYEAHALMEKGKRLSRLERKILLSLACRTIPRPCAPMPRRMFFSCIPLRDAKRFWWG